VSTLYHARLVFLLVLLLFAAAYAWAHLARRDR